MEALFAMLIGLGIGLYYCWQEAVVCLIASPLLMIGGVMEAKMQAGFSTETNEAMK